MGFVVFVVVGDFCGDCVVGDDFVGVVCLCV